MRGRGDDDGDGDEELIKTDLGCGVTDYHLVLVGAAAVGRGQGGRADLAVPGKAAGLAGRADRQGVDAADVAVAAAVVGLGATVARGPHVDAASALAALDPKSQCRYVHQMR